MKRVQSRQFASSELEIAKVEFMNKVSTLCKTVSRLRRS